VLLLAATLASLVVTVVAGYLTRLSLVEATWWVTHSDEVKLAIDECERALDHDDAGALRSAVAKVDRLTVDNPRQQKNTARARRFFPSSAHAPRSRTSSRRCKPRRTA
jgi:hypothetical protein